jgi:hypothetical protein
MKMLAVAVLLGAIAFGSYVSAQDTPVVTSRPKYTATDMRKQLRLEDVVSRVDRYLSDYGTQLENVVVEETYHQRALSEAQWRLRGEFPDESGRPRSIARVRRRDVCS